MNFQTHISKTSKFKLLFISFITLLFISCANEDDEAYFETLNETSFDYLKIELEILDIINDHRTSIGLSNLKKMNIISEVAKSHSEYMAKTGSVNHDNFPLRSKTLMTNAYAKSIGENVGFGYSNSKGAVNAWLQSDDHKKVIENSIYTHFGISITQNTKGKKFFTNIFIVR